MSAKPDIWMPIFLGDYLSHTMHLSPAEHGGYFMLMMAAWKANGALDDDDRKLATIARMTRPEWSEARPVLVEFFEVADGKWTHRRIVEELRRAIGFIEKQARNGRKGGRPRKAKENPEINPSPSPLPSPSSAPSPSLCGEIGDSMVTHWVNGSAQRLGKDEEAARKAA